MSVHISTTMYRVSKHSLNAKKEVLWSGVLPTAIRKGEAIDHNGEIFIARQVYHKFPSPQDRTYRLEVLVR